MEWRRMSAASSKPGVVVCASEHLISEMAYAIVAVATGLVLVLMNASLMLLSCGLGKECAYVAVSSWPCLIRRSSNSRNQMQCINATNRACLQNRRHDVVNAVAVETAAPRRCLRRDGAAAEDGETLLAIANLCQGRSPWSMVYGRL